MPITWLIYYVITPILGGLLATCVGIVANKPDTKRQLERLTPFAGAFGVWMLVDGILSMPMFLRAAEAYRGLLLIVVSTLVPTLIVICCVLFAGLVVKLALKKERSYARLVTYTSPLGALSILVGFVSLLYWLRIP